MIIDTPKKQQQQKWAIRWLGAPRIARPLDRQSTTTAIVVDHRRRRAYGSASATKKPSCARSTHRATVAHGQRHAVEQHVHDAGALRAFLRRSKEGQCLYDVLPKPVAHK